ncbi:MAG: thrombospondin type 3 repeat-containing protein, partial [Pseudomonadota bacterium]
MREATHPRVAGPLAGWKHALRYTSLGLLVSMLAPGALAFVDIDGDAVPDNIDNCTAVANPDQRDSDGDGIGNRCDVDFNNDCAVNAIDLGILRLAFFSTPATPNWNPDADV